MQADVDAVVVEHGGIVVIHPDQVQLRAGPATQEAAAP